MQKYDGTTVIAMVLIGSFAIERVVSAFFFLLSFSESWERKFPDPALVSDVRERARSARRLRFAYALASAVLVGVVLVALPGLRVLEALGVAPNRALDALVTGVILMGGADSLSGVLKPSASRSAGGASQEPIKVTGRLTLDQGPEKGALKAGD